MDSEWFRARKRELKVSDVTIGEAIRRDRSVVNRVIAGIIPFDLKYVEGFMEALKVSREEILARVGALPDASTPSATSNASVIPMEGSSNEKPQGNLPVYGTALGAEARIDGEALEQTTLNKSEVLEYVKRPVLLNGQSKAYALHIQGSSMHPALPDGEMIVVVPGMPLSIGDNVVVYLRTEDPDEDDGETARAVLVKEMVRRTARYVELRQYEPAGDFRIDMDQILRIDRVLTRKEMLS
ncbi:S24 family peptidase [Sphingomonas sp. CROZ-RG-20F-R02-07]|uniref:S24 family peptidase n=1 Tax=Sphingomonas sp. CROZ-RG-20F-R02-07 TaxID=2914832 RepID=UPI001F596499|nr:S24 family peptidase [Sphingomonas sp. CROZ-RG-20F-R02-07]